jgi:hypothetical protein
MSQRVDQLDFKAGKILKVILILSLSLSVLSVFAKGQSSPESRELFAGIELNSEGITAIAIRITNNEDGAGVKLINSETVGLSLELTDGAVQVAERVADAVARLHLQLQDQYRVPPEQIFIIGRSGIDLKQRGEIATAIQNRVKKSITFLDQATETQLTIVGTIRRRERVGNTLIDNRSSSVLIDVGNQSTRGGYELLKYLPVAQYDFVTMTLSHGTISFTNEVLNAIGLNSDWTALSQRAKAIGAGSLRAALRNEIAIRPGFINRKRVYLTGPIVWAMVTLLFPAERQSFVPITPMDISTFATQALRNQQSLLNPDLSDISDRKVRQEIENDLALVRSSFSSQQLIAGAELLKTIATELNWQDKKIFFARFGQLGCLLSYVRLQAEK